MQFFLLHRFISEQYLFSTWLLELILLFNMQRKFGVSSLQQKNEDDLRKLASAVYLQVSTISQALIFVTRSRNWSFCERPGSLLVAAFVIAQLVGELLIFHCIL